MQKLTRIFLLVLLLSALRYPLSAAYGAVPHLINYQGRLTDSSGKPLEGSYAVTFRIYDAETARSMLWEETHAGVVIQKGIFSVLLGSVTNLDGLPFNKQYYLEIKVGSEVMSPRQIIASAAYAIAGVPSGVIVMWSGSISNIPKGWVLCDGTNGTPDLRDRFIVGARQDDAGVVKTNVVGGLTQSGGSATISVANLPVHVHEAGGLTAVNSGAHTHPVITGEAGGVGPPIGGGMSGDLCSSDACRPAGSGTGATNSAGDHTHTLSGSTAATGLGMPYAPPYYALAYIMKL